MLSNASRETRKNYHVTLGELIAALNNADPNGLVYLTEPHSYRGYYDDLALEPADFAITVTQLLNQLNWVINTELTGYKGGEFMMSADTPVWVANHGCTGQALVDFDPATLTFTIKEMK